MDYEKEYKELCKRAKEYYAQSGEVGRDLIERIFPRLKRSDDEKLREELIKRFISFQNPQLHINPGKWEGLKISEILKWLEKQGKTAEEILILKDQIESLQAALVAKEETWKTRFEKLEHPEWSEEDKNRLRNLCFLVEHSGEGEATQKGFIN